MVEDVDDGVDEVAGNDGPLTDPRRVLDDVGLRPAAALAVGIAGL